jgi:hypothetical protein
VCLCKVTWQSVIEAEGTCYADSVRINIMKTDFELNVFNTKNYSAPFVTATNFTNSIYQLSGRMMTMKVSFKFLDITKQAFLY